MIPKTIKVEIDGEMVEVPNPAWEDLLAEGQALEEEAANVIHAEEMAARRAAEERAASESREQELEIAKLESAEVRENQRKAREADLAEAKEMASRILRAQEAEQVRLEILRETFQITLGLRAAVEGEDPAVPTHPEDSTTIASQIAFLMAYSDCGTIKVAAELARVPRAVHQSWMKDPHYAESFSLAQELASDQLEQEAIRRARIGVEEPVFYRGEVVGSVKKYSDALLTFLLKGNRPEKFRERFDISNPQDEMRKLATLLGVSPAEVANMLKSGDIPLHLAKVGMVGGPGGSGGSGGSDITEDDNIPTRGKGKVH